MPLEKLIADIVAFDEDSVPGAPATEAGIKAAEKSRGRKFHRAYREFLKLHDGWQHFAWGMNLRSVAELTGKKYDRGFIDDMDEPVTDEVDQALVIGWSENDASLILLTDKGEVLEWKYEVERRHKDFTALVTAHLKTLRMMAKADADTAKAIEQSWDPKRRAKAEAALAVALRKVKQTPPAKVTPPNSPTKKPAAVAPNTLVVTRKKTITAEVMQHLVLYLGAYPSADECLAAYHAWTKAYPVKGKVEWMAAGDFFPTDDKFDDAILRAAIKPNNGTFGLRISNDVKRKGGPKRYVLNVVGVPPTEDDTAIPRASFCEVIAPVTESPETLFALAQELLAILPVRSGHGGYAAYIWDEDTEPDPLPDIFAWCRRFFAVDIGTVDGWLPGTIDRLHGASWLTILGPAFSQVLAPRLKGLDTTKTDRGTIIRVGELSLGDVQRGEFPTKIAAVEAAIAPFLTGGYDHRSWVNFSGTFFDTQSEDLLPMRSHHATALYINRFLDPQAWVGSTPRERAEEILARVGKGTPYVKEWAAEKKTYIPQFDTLLLCVMNAVLGRRDDEALEALEFVTQFADANPAAWNALLWILDERKQHDRAMKVLPAALAHAPDHPPIFHNAAWLVFQRGDHGHAMQLIQDAAKHGYEGMDKLRDDPDFAPLHALPAWKKLFKPRRGSARA
ncbi:MAG: DUF3396 domain-containing protein [Kofleriaceae bacterium]